ncbi:MAG: ribosome maturation factor RimM [Bacteroidota bacterium]|nr:ribosome maturation factor RimM [Bacteroidota bacterium]
MKPDEFYYLGKILKVHGNKGHLWIQLETDDPEQYSGIDAIFIGIGHERVPYMIDDFELRSGNKAIIRFEDIHSTEKALQFTGKELFLPLSFLPKLKGKQFYFHEVTGYSVIDDECGEIGNLDSILELPGQSLMRIMHGNKEILIPANDETIRKVDHKNKKILIHAPEGLIDLYI